MVFFISTLFFITVCALMAVGLLKGKPMKGSCGGVAIFGADGEPLTCSTCPNRRRGKNVKYLKDGECGEESSARP